ncbi:RNA polymerase sigma factor [Chitinophaga filiformis]|uniref:Sigma-70 family RNA polymerase sigma factor n=1 Tax=Chitinophaga filiformis TaxID=104663 RepID=A0ABY4IDD4_CHIFI|nr:sigma-70 family RNA polymerase sigma factor [Chitinophaga filiformis]UPK72836.1 sigma-70 family RNA polymerase sigma factor [Chitinophaga filiformis]
MNHTIEVQRLRQGNEKAFVEMYHYFKGKVFNFLVKKVRDAEVAKELTQQCFIRIYQYRESLSDEHPLEKQVFITARSVLLNYLRMEDRKKARELQYTQQQFPEGESTTSVTGNFETNDLLEKILLHLSPVRKQVVLLKLHRGLSNKEIAAELSISVKTVENHITKAHHHMREIAAGHFLLLLFLLRL